MTNYPIPSNKCLLFVKRRREFISVVGLNHTKGGYFLNYYLNSSRTIFGNAKHDSRHNDLTVGRFTGEQDLFSRSDTVIEIDDEQRPELLPSGGITKDFFVKGISKKELNNLSVIPLVVSERRFTDGILVRVAVWPKNAHPTPEEMKSFLESQSFSEQLIVTFKPDCFPNRLIVAVYQCQKLIREFPIVNQPVSTNSTEWVPVGTPFIYKRPRKGFNK